MRKHQSKSWAPHPFRQIWAGLGAVAAHSRRNRRRSRNDVPACEVLESRLVLTDGVGASLLGTLSYVGVVTGPIVTGPVLDPPGPILPILPVVPIAAAVQSSVWSQLEADWRKLQAELQTLAAKSGVTISDLENLTSDSQAISQSSPTSTPSPTPLENLTDDTGFHFDFKSLNPVLAELAAAVAGGSSTSQAQMDFTALFTGSSVSTSMISTTFSDLVKTIGDSHVTTTDLTTVAADEAAIRSDLSKLPHAWIPGGLPWLDQQGDVPADLAVSLPPATTGPTAIATPVVSSPPAVVLPPIIISPFGSTSLLGSLSHTGVVTSPVIAGSQTPTTVASPFSQLQADVQKLRAELQALAEKSSVTVADLQALTFDGQAISQAGLYLNVHTLNPVISELATAVAGGSSTTQAQTDFTGVFSGTSVSTATITTTFNDVVKAIQDSNVTTTDLTTVATDQAAIQADLKKLVPVVPITPIVPIGPVIPIIPWSGSGTSGGGSTGSTSGTTSTGHHHKLAHVKKALVHAVKKAVSHAVKKVHSVALSRETKR